MLEEAPRRQKVGDALPALTTILDDFTRRPGWRSPYREHALAGRALTDGPGQPEGGCCERLDGHLAGGHNPLQRREARLVDAAGHGNEGGQLSGHNRIAGLALPLNAN